MYNFAFVVSNSQCIIVVRLTSSFDDGDVGKIKVFNQHNKSQCLVFMRSNSPASHSCVRTLSSTLPATTIMTKTETRPWYICPMVHMTCFFFHFFRSKKLMQ